MKQRITIEQLNELSDEQKVQLREWWTPQEGDFFSYKEPWGTNEVEWHVLHLAHNGEMTYEFSGPDLETHEANKDDSLPLPSIGQMTQFLYDNTNDWGIHYNDSGVCFYVYLSWTMETASPDRTFMADELVDALWKAVKRILK